MWVPADSCPVRGRGCAPLVYEWLASPVPGLSDYGAHVCGGCHGPGQCALWSRRCRRAVVVWKAAARQLWHPSRPSMCLQYVLEVIAQVCSRPRARPKQPLATFLADPGPDQVLPWPAARAGPPPMARQTFAHRPPHGATPSGLSAVAPAGQASCGHPGEAGAGTPPRRSSGERGSRCILSTFGRHSSTEVLPSGPLVSHAVTGVCLLCIDCLPHRRWRAEPFAVCPAALFSPCNLPARALMVVIDARPACARTRARRGPSSIITSSMRCATCAAELAAGVDEDGPFVSELMLSVASAATGRRASANPGVLVSRHPLIAPATREPDVRRLCPACSATLASIARAGRRALQQSVGPLRRAS